ncbi:MAG: HAMP domain-containing histidine kinase [Myxococcales bacterium]|nr:HAMP domain-containing histidine kinase [Myxococcales bacterium]
MTNLLNHADKYSSGKPIDLSIITGTTVTTLSVCDHGTGIAGHDLGRVFDRFELHVARQIVEAHGGSIDVDSEPGRGSTVTVRLPRQPAGTRPPADAPS